MANSIELKSEITYTCDQCGKTANSNSWRISLEAIEEPNVRLFEAIRKSKAIETRIYTGRTNIDFCSKDCAYKYLHHSTDMLIQELLPIASRTGSIPV